MAINKTFPPYPTGIGIATSKDPQWDEYERIFREQTLGRSAIPNFPTPEALEDFIKRVREANYWCELESYKEYLKLSEKHFPDDKVYGYHQRDKWKSAVKTFKESGLFE